MVPSSSGAVRGVRIEERLGERILSFRWFRWRMVGTALFVALWIGVVGFIFYFPLTSPAARKSLLLSGRLIFLAVGVFGFAMVYATAAHLLNRTTLRASHLRLTIAHGPLPWPGNRVVALADVAGVDCSEKRNSDYNTAFQTAVSYTVRLALRNGRHVKVAGWLDDPEIASAITGFLTERLTASRAGATHEHRGSIGV